MASANEIVKQLNIKVNGAQDIRELKAAIKETKTELQKLDLGSKEYKETVEVLTDGEKKLQAAMQGARGDIVAAKGSYRDLSNEMSVLKKVWKEVADASERERIGKRIAEINTELKAMDATIGNHQRNVGNYEEAIVKAFTTPQQRIKELRKQLAGLTVGTEEYNRVFREMADLTTRQRKLNEQLKFSSSDLGEVFSNLAGAAAGVAGGFSAINALMGLMGNESEDVQKVMLKVQQLMALVQGLSALQSLGSRIEGLSSAFKAFFGQMVSGNKSVAEFDTQAEAGAGAANDMANGLNNTRGAAIGASEAIDTTSVSITKLKEAYEGASGEEKKLLGAMMDVELDTYAEELATAKDETVLFQSATGRLKKSMADETVAVNGLSQAEQQLAVKNGNLLKSNLLLKDSLAQTNKWQILTRAATRLQIKQNEALIVGNTLQAASWKAATVAIKGFKVALASTGIGLIIVALGELLSLLGKGVSSLWGWVSGANAAKKATDDIKQATDDLNAALERSEKSWERQEKLMNAQGKTYDELYAARRKNLEAQLAEVKANIAAQEAIARDIGARKLQKKKYDEFRESLQGLYELQTKLYGEISDLSYDKYVHSVEAARKAEEDRAAAAKKAAEEAQKAREKEAQEAENLYKQTAEYFKNEITKLDEKYKKEKALLEKYGKDTTALTKKYEEDKTAIILKEMKARYDKIRDYNEKQDALIDAESIEYYENELEKAKEMLEALKDVESARFDENGEAYQVETDALKKLNAQYNLTMEGVMDYNQQIATTEKAVKDADKALQNFIETQKRERSEAAFSAYDTASQYTKKDNSTAQQSFELNFGKENPATWYSSGPSLSEQKEYMAQRQALIISGLEEEVRIWQAALSDPAITGEQRVEAQERYKDAVIELQDTLTQHTIESNQQQVESFQQVCDSMLTVAESIADIMGSVADMMLDNAKAQLEAGDITQEEYDRQFEAAKGVQIAQATINTIAGAIGAFTQASATIPPPYGQIVGGITAAAVVASGIAQINQIKKTKPGGSGSVSTKYAEAAPIPQEYNPQGMTNVTGYQETQDLANALSNKPIRAVVVESDVTAKQELARKRNSESTF